MLNVINPNSLFNTNISGQANGKYSWKTWNLQSDSFVVDYRADRNAVKRFRDSGSDKINHVVEYLVRDRIPGQVLDYAELRNETTALPQPNLGEIGSPPGFTGARIM